MQGLHDEIDLIRKGNLRYCQECAKTIKSKYFPYKTRTLCYECYEKQTGKTLHSFRSSLNFKKKYGSIDNFLKQILPSRQKVKQNKSIVNSKEDILSDCISGSKAVEISYKAKYGSRMNRVIEPKKITGGLIRAYCRFRKEERTFNIAKLKIIRIIE